MSRPAALALVTVSAVLFTCGCANRAETPDSPGQCPDRGELGKLVGQIVTLVGVQTRTKIPTVCGVDIDGDYALSDQKVEVTGRLERYEVPEPSPDQPIAASRGPGTYYRLIDPATGSLARSRESK